MTAADRHALLALVERLRRARVLVVGDVMLDHFVMGRVTRLSPEAPVPIVEFDHDEYRLGGAANVAYNVRALGGEVRLIGVIGHDEAGDRVRTDLAALGVTADLVTDPERPTTRKLRVIAGRNQQVARIDYEADSDVSPEVEGAVCDRLVAAGQNAQVIVVSDYLKGSVTRTVMASAARLARAHRLPLLVDPKIPHLSYYAGASLITPNHVEAAAATHTRIRTATDAREAARLFQRQARCDSVLITRGEHGMWLLDGRIDDGAPEPTVRAELDLPAMAREVSDVTGAGDTVIAALAVALAVDPSLPRAATLANHAAGIVVGKFGPATVGPQELVASLEAAMGEV